MVHDDVYRTVARESPEILHKDRKSKFHASVYPLASETEVRPIVEALRKKYPTANHVCYAWQLGWKDITYRANDDGEPNNSAGMPIYGQLQAFGVTNVLLCVTRIFGGTKLGVGGLIQAYRTAAQMALESAEIVERTIETHFTVHFGYPDMDRVMRIVKQQGLTILSQNMGLACSLALSVRLGAADQTLALFRELREVTLELGDQGPRHSKI